MKYSNTVEYNIKTSLDSKGLTQLKSELQQLELKLQNMGNKGLLEEKTFVDARNQIQGLGKALTDAFNPSLGILDFSKLNLELRNNEVTAQGLKNAFGQLGAEGQVAFNNLVGELGKLDTGIQHSNSQIDKLFTTFSNTFRWGLVSSFFSNFMNSIHQSIDYVKELDDSLTQIMLVTDYNRDSMNQFAKSANEAAKAVSMTTTGMTNASLIFAQQGYDLGQSQELATLSAKLANASQQDTATTSDQITAYMNAYGLENSIEELTQQMDNWALIANISAADVGELAQASQRAASMANAVGVSGEALAAQIATIESVTREAPEQIGNGLKTLYARFSDIAGGKEDEDGIGLGKVTSELQRIGVQVLDQFGNIRTMDSIMEDLMVVWDDLDQTSKIAASQALAGKYQVNRFMALMDNSDMYREYKGATGEAATGTLDAMSEEYADSIAGRSAKLQASLEGLFSTIFNTDDIYPWMDAAQGAVDLLQQFFDALGGGKTVLLGISSLLMQIFSKNMAQEINNATMNRAVQQQRMENLENSQAALTNLGVVNPFGQSSQEIIDFAQYIQSNAQNFNTEQMNQANSILQEMVQNSNAATLAADELKEKLSVIGTAITATTGESILAPFLDSEGAVNATLISEALSKMSSSQVADLFKNIQEDIQPARDGLLEFNKALQNYQQELGKVDSSEESWYSSVEKLEDALYNLEGKIDPDTYQRYAKQVAEITNITDDAGVQTAETTVEVAKLAEELEKVSSKDLTNLDSLNNSAFKAKNTASAREDSGKVAGAFQEGTESQKNIQEILDTFNAVQQLTFAWQAFQNLGSLWANEDLSTGEKVLQTIMNLTMAMPQLISAMQTLQGNSFLQNIGNGLMGVLNGTAPTVGDFEILGQESTAHLDSLKKMIEDGDKAKATMQELVDAGKEIPEEMRMIALAGDDARRGFEAAKAGMKGVVDESAEAITSGSTLATVFGKGMASAAAEGATGLGVLAGGLKAVAAEAWAFITGPAAPFIIAGAAIAAIAVAIGQAQEQAKKAHEQAMADFEDAKNVQQQVADLSTKMDDWKSKRQSEGDNKELAQEVDALADSLRELGNEEEANALHLAAITAETNNTTFSFNALEDAVIKAQQAMSDQSALDAMNAANAILKDRLSTEEEIAAAQKTLQNAALDYNLSQASRTNGMEMGVLGVAGDEDLHAATMDWQSLNSVLEQSVPGFKEITDENERLALALSHTSDEAQQAAIEIQQILNANESLEGASRDGGRYQLNKRDVITRDLENTGLDAEQSLELLLRVDDSSYETMRQDIQTVMEHINGGEPFKVAIQAIMDEQQTEDYIKSQLAAYEPKDEDVESEDFQSLSNMFMDNADKMGEEGSPFEDYSEDLLNNADALEEVVEGILRYDDAVQTLDKNLENWQDVLNNTNKFSKEHIDAVQELQETYADFLDLSEDMNVSEEFAANADNLELMEDAANGVEGAYERLANAAAEDILIHADVSDIDAARTALTDLTSELPSLFEGVDIGGELNLDSVRQQINDLADATGWTADQMAAYLNSIGINIDPNMFEPANTALDNVTATAETMANNVQGLVSNAANAITQGLSFSADTEMTEKTATKNDQIMYTNLIPSEGEGVDIDGEMPSITPATIATAAGEFPSVSYHAHIPGVQYTPDPVRESQVKEMTGYGIKSEVTNGPGGQGGVKLKNEAAATRGSRGISGAGKSSGGSRPSSGGGGGGKGKSCFVAGTLVTMCGYYQPIELTKPGQIVLSYNEKLQKNEYSIILQTMVHNIDEEIYTLYIKDEQLKVTGNHRFLIKHNLFEAPQWLVAEQFKIGDWVLFADNTWHLIWKIEINIETTTVYNFEVSNNHNYYVGRNQILAHNKGGGGKKGSGGGGGGKAKTIEPKEKKKHEKDYYEEVNNELEKTEKILAGVQKEEDRLVGDEARANQNKQLKLLQKEILLQKEKLKILIEQEQKDVTKKLQDADKEAEKLLEKYTNFTIPNPQYDEDGIIANYEQISQAIDDAHNEMIEKYNDAAAAGDEELTKQIQKDIENFDKLGESVLKNAQRSNKIQSEIEDIKNTIEELDDAMEDIAIDAYKASQQAIDKLQELNNLAAKTDRIFRKRDDNSFMNRFSIDETPYDKITEALGRLSKNYNVTKKQATEYYDTLIAQKKKALKETSDKDEQEAIQKTIDYYNKQKKNLSSRNNLDNGLLGMAQEDLAQLNRWAEGKDKDTNPFGDNTAALYDALDEAENRVVKLWDDYAEDIKEVRDGIIELFDDQEEAIERNIKKYETLLEDIERMSDVTKLYYGEDSYEKIIPLLNQQEKVMQSEYAALQTAYNHWVSEYQSIIKTGDDELIKKTEEKMNDARDAMMSKAQELAELFVEEYQTAVDNAIKKTTESVWGKTTSKIDKNGNVTDIQLGLEDQTTMWELQKDYMSRYKDDVEKSFEIDKLRSKYQDLLNESQGMSLQTQNRIRAQMQEQLELLQNQGTVSEYDVKLANAKLEILQKQIALEDAQRNKNKMQLRRDTQGNYRYVYTADKGNVKKAQDELTESQYDAYEMTKQETISNNDRAINLYNDYMNKMREIAIKYQGDTEARNAAMMSLNEEYGKLLTALEEDFKDTTNGLYDILCWMVETGTQDTATAAKDMMTSVYDENGKILDNIDSDVFSMTGKIQKELPKIKSAATEAMQGIEAEAGVLKAKMVGENGTGGIMKDINLGADSMDKALEKVTEQTAKWAEETQKLFESFSADNPDLINAKDQLAQLEKQLKRNSAETSSIKSELDKATQERDSAVQNSRNWETKAKVLMGQEDVAVGQTYKLEKDLKVWYAGDGDRATAGYSQHDTEGNQGFILKKGTEVEVHTAHQKSEGGRDAWYPVAIFAKGKTPAKEESDNSVTARQQKQMWHVDQASFIRALSSFDTGGYTGSWIDKKSGKLAMLHQKELVLNAQDTQNILQATQIMRDITSSFAGRMSSFLTTKGSNLTSNLGDTIEQRVDIQASFPNATDADDIRTALLGLADKAYQYAHRSI